jgi:hypothetical protein
MKNIFLIPTDKPSRLHNKNGELGNYPSTKLYIEDFKGNQYNSFHIYITSEKEIKDGWSYDRMMRTVNKIDNVYSSKIILTTDQDLIKDGVQAIDDDFLEWFVKNPSCEEVGLEREHDDTVPYPKMRYVKPYKIIIPQEEPEEMLMSNCVIFTAQEKLKQEPNFYEKLKEYFETTPREKVLEDWNKSAHLDKVGPTVDEFIENSQEQRLKETAKNSALNFMIDSKQFITKLSYREYGEYGYEKGFLEGVKSDAARDYWYEKFQQEQEEDLKTAYFSGIKTTGEGWNGEYANGNNPSIEKEFQKEFQEWLRHFKKK